MLQTTHFFAFLFSQLLNTPLVQIHYWKGIQTTTSSAAGLPLNSPCQRKLQHTGNTIFWQYDKTNFHDHLLLTIFQINFK